MTLIPAVTILVTAAVLAQREEGLKPSEMFLDSQWQPNLIPAELRDWQTCCVWTVFCLSWLTIWKCELEMWIVVHREQSPITAESGWWEMKWEKGADSVCWDSAIGQKKSTQKPEMLGLYDYVQYILAILLVPKLFKGDSCSIFSCCVSGKNFRII